METKNEKKTIRKRKNLVQVIYESGTVGFIRCNFVASNVSDCCFFLIKFCLLLLKHVGLVFVSHSSFSNLRIRPDTFSSHFLFLS